MNDNLIRSLKKHKINLSDNTLKVVNFNQDEIQRLLPHRMPFLLIDYITQVDLTEEAILLERKIMIDDPVFKGHFPGDPLYPGVLQIEMMGQAGLCLAHFVIRNTIDIPKNVRPISAVFTKVHHTSFVQPVHPDDLVSIRVKMIEHDTLMGLVAGQVFKGEDICSFGILEVYFSE